MAEMPVRQRLFQPNFQSNLIAGLLTVAPLIAAWLVFDFFLQTLSDWGHPLALAFINFTEARSPLLKPWLDNTNIRWILGVIVALLALYTIGAIASRVIGQRAIGFVMRTFPDSKTGEELAAVYVPTAPNPTSGYLQIVPLARLTPTDIQGDQAMAMILSGGAVTPDHVSIAR